MATDFSKVTDLELMQELQRRMNDVECEADTPWYTNVFGERTIIYAEMDDGDETYCRPTFEFDTATGKLVHSYNDLQTGDFWEQLDTFLDDADFQDCVQVAKKALDVYC